MIQSFVQLYLALAVAMGLTWLLQRRTVNAGYVDVAWAACIGLAALYIGLVADGSLLVRLLVAMMAGIWGARLAMHLLVRVLFEPEDGRYRALREHWGPTASVKMFWFFQAQALIALMFAVPLWIAAQNPEPGWTLFKVLAVVIWIISLCGEALADHQLAQFRSHPGNRGRTCRVGLWRYSRHPNYFFEFLHWFAYGFLAIGAPHAWIAWLGPLVMLAFLYRITGIPYTEQQALRSRGDDYRDYQSTTSALIPWPPRPSAVVSTPPS